MDDNDNAYLDPNYTPINYNPKEMPVFISQQELDELKTQLATAQQQLEIAENKLRYTEKAFSNRDRQWNAGRELIKEMIVEGDISEKEHLEKLVEVFDIEILREVNFTVTIEVSGTVEIPLGSELDEYSFSIDGLSYDGTDVTIDNDSISIDDWDFTE